MSENNKSGFSEFMKKISFRPLLSFSFIVCLWYIIVFLCVFFGVWLILNQAHSFWIIVFCAFIFLVFFSFFLIVNFFSSQIKVWSLSFIVITSLVSSFFFPSYSIYDSLLSDYKEASLLYILLPLLITSGIFICFILLRLASSFLCFQLIRNKNLIPKISQTEREALLAGTSWIEKEFFTGRLNFKNLFNQKFPQLTEAEKIFLNTKVEELCEISKEWDWVKKRKPSQKTEDFLKKEKFFGLIIPKKYQGRGFSPLAHTKVIEKLASHNTPLAIITMVPNSLGPAELLLNYGTEEQKNKYLPKLATGEELPCFGLTEVQAGSDASSIKSEGILFKEGDQLKIRLNWEKRWITLSAKATLIGLAVQLKDPEQLYSEKKDLGITCLLIPSQTSGVERGFYHDPMNIPIYNAPIKGKDVVVSAEEAIVGGLKQAGKGWKMLMESLSAGRGISLPALSTGCGKKIAWLTGAHALVRKQFGLPIGKFEGVQEALASIAGGTHLISAVQTFTLSALNQGIHSSVVSALTKYNLTETAQEITKKGMDVMGGAGLSLGPKNKIAFLYLFSPMAITVEGANILTRTLIVYGQGLIKTHPYIYKMITALEQNNFKNFHRNLWSLLFQLTSNFFMGIIFSLTRAWFFINLNPFSKKEFRYLGKLAWTSSLFAFLSDLSFMTLGSRLKMKGQLTGRFSDLLSFQYMATALLWHWRQTGSSENSWTKTKWGLEYCFSKIQDSFTAILKNHPSFWIRMILKPWLFLLKINPIGSPPSDKLSQKLAGQLLEDEEFRKELCSDMYFPKDPEDQFQKLKKAYQLSFQENKILKKIEQKAGQKISAQNALEQGIISAEENGILKQARQAQWEAIQVDTFTEEEYFG